MDSELGLGRLNAAQDGADARSLRGDGFGARRRDGGLTVVVAFLLCSFSSSSSSSSCSTTAASICPNVITAQCVN